MSKPHPQWLIPIVPDARARFEGATTLIIRETNGTVELGTDGPGGPLFIFSSLESCQLGMALQDASRVAGQSNAKRKRATR